MTSEFEQIFAGSNEELPWFLLFFMGNVQAPLDYYLETTMLFT